MNSSPSRAALRPASTAAAPKDPREVLAFPYSEVAFSAHHHFAGLEAASLSGGESASDLAVIQARELGRQQGERESRAKFEEQLAHQRAAVARALTDFARERAAYYQKSEPEAVQPALSIARKVLHPEAHVDTLLLMGSVGGAVV